VSHPGVRASDEDRHRVVAELERHTAAGRLTLAEYSDRAARAYACVTVDDLAAVTHDLPALPRPEPSAAREHRHLLVALLLAALTIGLLAVAIALWK
jgi:hypothetical protein